jgi:hypothetical protein
MQSSGMLRRVALIRTYVSEERSASIFWVTRIGELGTALAYVATDARFEEVHSITRTTRCKSKAISVTGRGGLKGCKMLRIPHCLDNRLTDGGKIVSPTLRPLLYSPETIFLCLWYSFLLEAE